MKYQNFKFFAIECRYIMGRGLVSAHYSDIKFTTNILERGHITAPRSLEDPLLEPSAQEGVIFISSTLLDSSPRQ